MFAVIGLVGCDKQVAAAKFAPANPIESVSLDAHFLRAIDDAQESNPDDFIKDLRARDYRAPLERDQFETTLQYQARVNARKPLPIYGRRYVAFLQPLEFDYNADTQVLSFRLPYDTQRQTYLQVARSPTLTIVPVGEAPPTEWRVTLAPNDAERFRYAHFELAVITTLEGLQPPVLAGPVDDDALFTLPSTAGSIDDVRRNVDQSVSMWMGSEFAVKTHVNELLVFDPYFGGAEKPIYRWTASKP